MLVYIIQRFIFYDPYFCGPCWDQRPELYATFRQAAEALRQSGYQGRILETSRDVSNGRLICPESVAAGQE